MFLLPFTYAIHVYLSEIIRILTSSVGGRCSIVPPACGCQRWEAFLTVALREKNFQAAQATKSASPDIYKISYFPQDSNNLERKNNLTSTLGQLFFFPCTNFLLWIMP
uniref:Uncharacterized protein n=1 Tax=Hippocampus comes TaxID=109280 RepID=A0A3Q2YYX2_HIPCM